MNVELDYMKNAKGAPMGNVINAGVAVGLFPDFDVAKNFIKVDQTHHPDAAQHEIYEKYFAVYRELYGDVKRHYETISRIRND